MAVDPRITAALKESEALAAEANRASDRARAARREIERGTATVKDIEKKVRTEVKRGSALGRVIDKGLIGKDAQVIEQPRKIEQGAKAVDQLAKSNERLAKSRRAVATTRGLSSLERDMRTLQRLNRQGPLSILRNPGERYAQVARQHVLAQAGSAQGLIRRLTSDPQLRAISDVAALPRHSGSSHVGRLLQPQGPAVDAARTAGSGVYFNELIRRESELSKVRRRSADALRSLTRQGPYAATSGGPGSASFGRVQGLLADQQRLAGHQQTAGGGVRLPPPPPPPPTPPYGGPPGSTPGGVGPTLPVSRLEDAKQATSAYRQEVSRLVQVHGSANPAMRAHGTLTAEFVQAARRGEVTMRELGYQTGATIGKFGGWLGAGAALYGVIGAVSQLGRGAIDAYSGVNQLQRVITDDLDAEAARKSFRDLSQEFNLPIDEVTEASYQMGKIFHDQARAAEAARSVLFAVKVGELDNATATRYLTAITNGYNLSIQDQAVFLDQVNQAQNKFGATIPDVLAGTAKAAGTFKAAGGELRNLTALITTAQRAIGITGQVAGTALARSPNFLRKQGNQSVLQGYGIDPTAPIDDIIEEAFKLSRNLPGDKIQELAAAIFGPLYGARVGTPLLQQEDLYTRVQNEIAPGRAKGSAQRELDVQLQAIDEQIKKIGISLQSLGANLAESNFLDSFGVLVAFINKAIEGANSMLEIFNKLPEGVQRTVAYFAQISLLLRGLQRLQLGESLRGPPGASPGGFRGAAANFFDEGDRGVGRRYRTALYRESQFIQDERARVTSTAARQGLIAEQADRRRIEATAQRENIARTVPGYRQDPRFLKAVEAHERAEARATAARANIAELDDEQRALAQRQEQLNRQTAKIKGGPFGLFLNRNAAQEARAAGVGTTGAYIPAQYEIPGSEAPQRVAKTPSGLIIAGSPETLDKAQAEADRQTREVEKQREKVGRVRGSFRRFGGALTNLVSYSGLLVGGAFTIGIAAELLKSFAEGLEKRIEGIRINANSAKQASTQASKVAAEQLAGQSPGEVVSDIITGAPDFLTDLGLNPLGTGIRGVEGIAGLFAGADGPAAQRRKALAEQEQANYRLQLEQQNEALREGKPVPFRYASDISRDAEKLRERGKGRSESLKALRQYDEELAKSQEALNPGGTKEEQEARAEALREASQQIRDSIAGISEGRKSFIEAFQSLDPDKQDERLAVELGGVGGPLGYDTQKARRSSQAYDQLVRDLGGSGNTDDIERLTKARDSFFDDIDGAIQDELDRALLLARSPSDRQDAYSEAFSRLRQSFVSNPQREVQRQQEEVERLQSRLGAREVQITERGITSTVDISKVGPEAAKRLKQRLKGATAELERLQTGLKERRRFYEEIKQELREQRFAENSSLREARVDLRVSRTNDPLAEAKRQIQFLGGEVQRAIKVFGRGSTEVLSLLQRRQEALRSAAEAELSLRQAQGRLRAAGEGNDTERAKIELENLRADLQYMLDNSDRFSPEDIINLRADILEAERDLAKQAKEDAQDIRAARFELEKARAGDNDVLLAKIAVREALYNLRQAETPAERISARAELVNARRGKREAIFNAQVEDIQFQADIGRLTLQQQISQFQRLLRNAQITRDQRRDLRRRIAQLQDEAESEAGGFDLKLGQFKLPTIYEIRRAARAGIDGGSSNVAVTTTNNVTINANGTSASEVFQEFEKRAKRGNRAALRSAGI